MAVEECEHEQPKNIEVTAEEIADLRGGECRSCEIVGVEKIDGFRTCPCCGMAWKLDHATLTMRIPYVIVDGL